jgi:hypothetical protein
MLWIDQVCRHNSCHLLSCSSGYGRSTQNGAYSIVYTRKDRSSFVSAERRFCLVEFESVQSICRGVVPSNEKKKAKKWKKKEKK